MIVQDKKSRPKQIFLLGKQLLVAYGQRHRQITFLFNHTLSKKHAEAFNKQSIEALVYLRDQLKFKFSFISDALSCQQGTVSSSCHFVNHLTKKANIDA